MQNSHTRLLGLIAIVIAMSILTGFFFYRLSFHIFTRTPLLTMSAFFIVIAVLLNMMLVWRFYLNFRAQSSWLSQFVFVIGMLGTGIVFIGAAFEIMNTIVYDLIIWFPVSQTQSIIVVGYGFIGIWLLLLNYQASVYDTWSLGLIGFGIVAGIIMAIGLLATPRIFIPYVSLYHQLVPELGELVGNLGWRFLYPVWSLWFGWIFLRGQYAKHHLHSPV